MADSSISVTAGSGVTVDTRTEGTNGNHRQVVVLGDPATNAGVAPVDATNGLAVTLTTALPASTAAIGKLAANTGVDIGDVDVTSISAGTNLIGKVGIDQVTANANEVVVKSGTVTAVTAITNALPAGTNAIGKLASNTGVDIGDVDVTSISAGTNLIGKVGIDQVTANANEVVVKSGTVTAVTAITNALPAGTNAIGKLVSNTGVDIGDVDVTSISAGDNNIGNVDLASAIPAGTNTVGSVFPSHYELAGNTLHVKKYYTSAGAATDGIVWSPAAGKRWYVTDLIINVSAAATVTLEDDLAAGDSPVLKAELAANSGIAHSFTTPLYSGEDEADLLVTTNAGNVYITATGYEV